MKKSLSISLAILMIFASFTIISSAQEALPTASTVLVNGEITAFDAYNIDGNNYFKLRDLAYVLNGTQKQFEVGWDAAANAISLTSGSSYTAVGGEMEGKGDGAKVPSPTNSKILLDGNAVQLTAYNIEGNNYFKLRDIGAAFNFGVDWDAELQTISIDTSKGYTIEMDTTPIRQSAGKIRRLADSLPGGMNIYYAIIPDKSQYSAIPAYDMSAVAAVMREEMGGIASIDLTRALAAEDFYNTDLHWKQPNLTGVLNALGGTMGFSDRLEADFTEHTAGSFLGIHADDASTPEDMAYLTNSAIDNATVRYLNDRTFEMEEGLMYDLEAFGNPNPYDMFLRGARPLIEITNPSAATDKSLYIFRDSYSANLTPLLTSAYAHITLIDLRYLDSRMLPEFVDFAPGSDVLFLYGVQLLNSPSVILAP